MNLKNIKKFICSLLTLIMIFSWTDLMPAAAQAEELQPGEPAGWYLKDYYLVINNKRTSGTFSQGGTYTDIVSIFDSEGNEMQTLKSDFENEIRLNYGRYGQNNDFLCGYSQAVSWDSPEDYYAGGKIISLTGVSNMEISHETWGCRAVSARFNLKTIKDTYDYKFINSNGSDQFGIGSDEITIQTDKVIPKALRGDVAYLIINFDSSTSADSQAIYTYVWKAPTVKLNAKTCNPKPDKKGWYLTGYRYEDTSTAYYESNFSDGSKCIDTITVLDANGDSSRKTYLENDVYVYNERYLGAYIADNFGVGVRYEVKWDSPASYIAPGGLLKFNNFSNQVIASTDVWGTTYVHTYVQTNGFNTEISDTSGNSWPGATGPVTLTSNSAFPEGNAGQKMTVYFEICSIGKAIYTYTWMNANGGSGYAKPSLASSKVTLYLSGGRKKLSHKIGLKNAKGYIITYRSRKNSVATVNKDGVITARKAGKANITVRFKGDGKVYTKIFKVVVKKY